ncbi:MAG: hypothetical protein CBB71_10770 [Rhodopirellula sp. TMED11]|nr:MAG: hypothetical protein CBB71_10770 [Rhodopirellula sp. TMED11]
MFADCVAELVVMEACGSSEWINDLAIKHGLKAIVCSINEEAWYAGCHRINSIEHRTKLTLNFHFRTKRKIGLAEGSDTSP